MNYTKYSKAEQESIDSLRPGSQDDGFSDNESGLPIMSQQPRSFATRLSHVAKRSWWLVDPILWLLSLLLTWMVASAVSKSPYDISAGLETELGEQHTSAGTYVRDILLTSSAQILSSRTLKCSRQLFLMIWTVTRTGNSSESPSPGPKSSWGSQVLKSTRTGSTSQTVSTRLSCVVVVLLHG